MRANPVLARTMSTVGLPLLLTAGLGGARGGQVKSKPPPPVERVSAKDGAAQVWVPAGTFVMGADDPRMAYERAEAPPHEVVITRGFWLDRYEVTNEQYARFLDRYMQKEKRLKRHEVVMAALGRIDLDHPLCGVVLREDDNGFSPKPGWERLPVMPVKWTGANDYCVTMGKRLPTEAEWEYAARGAGGGRYPWGDQWDPTWTNVATGKPAPVGSYEEDVTAFGAMDMAGNVREWVRDRFDVKYYSNSPVKDPLNAAGAWANVHRVIRGGGFAFTEWDSRATSRGHRWYGYYPVATGFRCAESSPPPKADAAAGENVP